MIAFFLFGDYPIVVVALFAAIALICAALSAKTLCGSNVGNEIKPQTEPDYNEMLSKYGAETQLTENTEMLDIYTYEDESILTNVIMSGNETKAQSVLDGFFKQIETGNREMANYLVMNLIRTFVKLIANIKIKKDENKYKFENMLRIIRLDSRNDMKESIMEIACDLCNEIKLIKPDTGESVSKRVGEYVEQNYSNHDLDVSKISDFLGFSPAYAIKLFKQETGEGISSYINRIRVEKAKELLLLDFYRVEQIAKMVGFLDSRALSRSFKRFYGVTPTQYRDISSLETDNMK